MSAQPARGYLGISEVLAQLRPEFADISVSKIRFLETEGLIAPARSPSGYRRFSAQDVDRLRFILTAQRDQYLPLRVIRERLDRLDQVSAGSAGLAAAGRPGAVGMSGGTGLSGGIGDPSGGGRQPGQPWSAEAGRANAGVRTGGRSGTGGDREVAPAAGTQESQLTRRELLDQTGVSEALLTELETFGLLRRSGRYYSPDAVEVARTAGALTAFGVEARHLRAVRAAAERESTMIESLLAPILRQRGSGARELAGRTARECALLVLRLHAALVDGALAEAGLAGPGIPAIDLTSASTGARDESTAVLTEPVSGHGPVRQRAGNVGGASA
jgi:DNA-binding transcriptional MerR regulator